MEETANTGVEEQTGASDSSSDEQVNLEELSQEELIAEVQKEREAKQRAIAHARNKDRKDQERTRSQETQEELDEDVEEEDIKSIIAQEVRKERMSTLKEGSEDWLKKQSFAEDLFQDSDQSDKAYAKFNIELARLEKTNDVKTQGEYIDLMRLAHVNVTGKPDALLAKESAEESITRDKRVASSGYRGGSSQAPVAYPKMSEQNTRIIERINSRRKARGEDPMTPKEVTELLRK